MNDFYVFANVSVIVATVLLACTTSFSATDGRKHFYGEWTNGNELTFLYNISANNFSSEIVDYTALGIPFKSSQPILKWEPAKNNDRTLNASFPNGYLVRTELGNGNPTYFYLWKHYKDKNMIMYQPEEFFLKGKYDILYKSVPFKQTDYYGEWNITNLTYIDELSIIAISEKHIKYSSVEESGKPIEINFPILRWEYTKNPDSNSVAGFPDGYIISTESDEGHPRIIFLWRLSKTNDMILFQLLDSENDLFLIKSKKNSSNYSQGGKTKQKDAFTDSRDGKTYKTVKIGTQTWMAENLNYNASGSKCYDNKTANCNKYGRLYDWNTAMKACPNGWHLSTNAEWEVLIKMLGGFKIAGKHLKAKSGWNRNGNGTDTYGFAALPGGKGSNSFRDYFNAIGQYGYWWNAPEKGYDISQYMDDFSEFVYSSNASDRSDLRSVRCLKD